MGDAQQAREAQMLRREIVADLFAVRSHLIAPYPDDPRWTPWDRFVERALRNVDALASRLVSLETERETLQRLVDAVEPLIEPMRAYDNGKPRNAVWAEAFAALDEARAALSSPASEEGHDG